MKIPSPDHLHEILIARRNKKMAHSPHTYMRATLPSITNGYTVSVVTAHTLFEKTIFPKKYP